jgi:hypothetical protein
MAKRRDDSIKFEVILQTWGEGMVDACRKYMEQMADKIVADAKSRCPVDTGRLRDSIHWEWTRDREKIRIVADAKNPVNKVKYGRIVEFDPRINKPFLYPAMDDHKDEYKAGLERVMKEEARHV